MRYMLWMLDDGTSEPSPSEIRAMPGFQAWERELAERGIEHRGQRLRPPADAVTVRVRGGEILVTDGPFADTKEHIGGYEILDAEDLDQAIEVASAHPSCRVGVEIRPFHAKEHGR
ncbi:transcription initiation protein [Actinoplanes sp. NEAU-A11]|uniref:Transcription initiation protein n=2 Tax=Actinoplanes aureus TaxID=2792083 RepID=A0A931FZT7_9ACTN|nr:transcription initiation protein [Actinoplanes aureus]